ncbi:sugar phosphate isomerase/epimerase family protein [Thalassospira australica]|uniref:sugar phosphate isomerase/epimerase family protein n=1 Tax=Thalassospira australica TaxID=1528106 RepID=UPI00051A14FB|nr:sugar phosphate isomerase/epimerase family protein [Thalassospira australica]
MDRKFGCCTWIFGDAPLTVTAGHMRKAGLDGVELFGDVAGTDPVKAREILANEGLSVFSVTPGDADISHPDPAIRAKAIAYYDALMDWAKELGNPLISCHGQVTRIKPVTSQDEEDGLLIDATRQICDFAKKRGLAVVFEILNRYETHQVRTVEEGLAFLEAVGAENLKLLPDAYHMNIEEENPAAALLRGGDKIGLYHAADSNRAGVGEGHTDFAAQIRSLDQIAYAGPVIFEVNAPGPNPFTPDKGPGFRDIVEAQLEKSVRGFRALAN